MPKRDGAVDMNAAAVWSAMRDRRQHSFDPRLFRAGLRSGPQKAGDSAHRHAPNLDFGRQLIKSRQGEMFSRRWREPVPGSADQPLVLEIQRSTRDHDRGELTRTPKPRAPTSIIPARPVLLFKLELENQLAPEKCLGIQTK